MKTSGGEHGSCQAGAERVFMRMLRKRKKVFASSAFVKKSATLSAVPTNGITNSQFCIGKGVPARQPSEFGHLVLRCYYPPGIT